jgi:hypothetical protein
LSYGGRGRDDGGGGGLGRRWHGNAVWRRPSGDGGTRRQAAAAGTKSLCQDQESFLPNRHGKQ